jgi:hypothetical protein
LPHSRLISMRFHRLAFLFFALLIAASTEAATNVVVDGAVVDMDRWMYPFNATPGTRPSASVFGTTGEESGVDSRHAQFLVGWNTSNSVPTGRGTARYVVKRATLTLTINRDMAWVYDGTQDAFQTYLSTNDSRLQADTDPGRPLELFGAGFRNGYTAATFPEDGPFTVGGGSLVGTRSAYAAGFDTNGVLVDVSNNVGKADADAFEVTPFAVGIVEGMAAGDLVSTGARVEFEINVGNPEIAGYLRAALNEGVLRLMVTSMAEASFSGPATFPQFYTRDNVLATDADKPLLHLDVELTDTLPLALSAVRESAGVVLRFENYRGGTVALEHSDNLAQWTEQTLTPTAGAVPGTASWTPPVDSDARFFRLKTP